MNRCNDMADIIDKQEQEIKQLKAEAQRANELE